MYPKETLLMNFQVISNFVDRRWKIVHILRFVVSVSCLYWMLKLRGVSMCIHQNFIKCYTLSQLYNIAAIKFSLNKPKNFKIAINVVECHQFYALLLF